MINRNCGIRRQPGVGFICMASRRGIGFGAEVQAKMDIADSMSSLNATGIDSASAGTEIRVSRTTVSRNTVNGLGFNGGTILSSGNNEVSGNAGNNGPFSPGGTPLQ